MFQRAVKSQAKLRLGLDGPSGSGKTYTALVAAAAIANGGKIAVIDTERSSASLYADLFEFDVMCLDNFHPQKYIDGIHEAEKAGYAVIVIDSLSHAWEGEGGVLDLHDQAVKRQRTENSFTAWKDVTPIHRSLVDAMLQSSCHIIATMRSKTEYVIETVESNGRTVQRPRKIGMAPIQRQGMEYEFTIVGDIDTDHTLSITKSRMSGVADAVITKPGKEFFAQILAWLNSGAAPVVPVTQPPAPAPQAEQPEQPKVNINIRPYQPSRVKDALIAKAAKHTDFVPTAGQYNLLRYGLELCFPGDDAKTVEDKRHTFLNYVTGQTSTKKVTGQMFKAIIEDWLKMEQDSGGEYHINEMAAKEANMIVTAALVGEGQQSFMATQG